MTAEIEEGSASAGACDGRRDALESGGGGHDLAARRRELTVIGVAASAASSRATASETSRSTWTAARRGPAQRGEQLGGRFLLAALDLGDVTQADPGLRETSRRVMPRCIRCSRSTSPSRRRNSTMRVSLPCVCGPNATREPVSSPRRIADTADSASAQVRSWTAAPAPDQLQRHRGRRSGPATPTKTVPAGFPPARRGRRRRSCSRRTSPRRPAAPRSAIARAHSADTTPCRSTSLGRHAEHVDLHLGGVGDHPADVRLRRPGHRRQQRGQPAAGQRLRRGQRRAASRSSACTSAADTVMSAMLASATAGGR